MAAQKSDSSSVIQLEIRGVGGETAEEILGGPVYQVGDGDRLAGFYRRRSPVLTDSESQNPEHTVEAYEWGRLTTGSSGSVIWWLLLPFTLLNVAGWMFQPIDSLSREGSGEPEPRFSSLWWGRLLVVLLGLTLTTLYIGWVLVLAVEITALDCGSQEACRNEWFFLLPLNFFDGDAYWRLAAGLSVAMALLLGLFGFIVVTQQRTEGYEPDKSYRFFSYCLHAESKALRHNAVEAFKPRDLNPSDRLRSNSRLEDVDFWYRWDDHRRLLRWHLGVAMVTFGAIAGYATVRLGRGVPNPGAAWVGSLLLIAAVVSGLWKLTTPETWHRPRCETIEKGKTPDYEKQQPPWWRILWITVYFALALLAGVVTAYVATSAGVTVDDRLGLVGGLGYLQAVMLVVSLGLAWPLLLRWRKRRKTQQSRSGSPSLERAPSRLALARGFRFGAPLVVAALGAYVTNVGFGSVAFLLAEFLYGPAGDDQVDHAAAYGYDVISVDLFFIALTLLALWALLEWSGKRWFGDPLLDELRKAANENEPSLSAKDLRKFRLTDAVAMDYFPNAWRKWKTVGERRAHWIRGVAGARWLARGGRQVDLKLTALVGLMSVLLVIHVLTTESSIRFWEWGDAATSPAFGLDGLRWMHSLASWTIGLWIFPGVLLLRSIGFFNRQRRRQGIGKVWDVLSFWPRRYHPLAAPCYAERAIPDLRQRVKAHLSNGKRVMLSAHSQGTVIAVAALLQIKGENEDQYVGKAVVNGRTRREEIFGTYFQRDDESRKHHDGDDQKLEIPRDDGALKNVAMITFGSPLGRLYANFFLSHFGTKNRLAELRQRLLDLDIDPEARGWYNLYRPTDYIGQEIFIAPGGELPSGAEPDADVRILEAANVFYRWDSHSHYELESGYQNLVDSLVARLENHVAGAPPSDHS